MIELHLFDPDPVETELLELGLRPGDDPSVSLGSHTTRPDLRRQRLDDVNGNIVDQRAFAKQHRGVRELGRNNRVIDFAIVR